MKSLIVATIVLICSFFGYSQELSVSGTVTDIEGVPVEFATIVVYDAEEETVLKGTSTDDKGFFIVNTLAADTYIIKISFIGYTSFDQKIVLTGDLDLKTIQLAEDTEHLDEVNIIVKKPTLERQADRLVFNVENTALIEGNMLQVLKNTPSVLVIGDVITVKNSNPTVYINNRKVHLSPSDLTQLLEGSSANAIKSIEVITNPSSRYDAESGVVLNIVMSKNIATGYRGSIYSNYTQAVFPRYNIGTSHFLKKKNVSFNVNYNYAKNKINREGDDTVNFLNNMNEVEESWRSLTDRNTWTETHNLNANVDYFINDNNTLSVSTNSLLVPYFKYKINNNTIISDNNGDFLERFTANNLIRDTKYNLGFDLDYNHDFRKGRLGVNAHYTTYNYERSQSVESQFFDTNDVFQNRSAFNTDANQDTQIIAAKADYSLPIGEHANIETGVKFSVIHTESDLSQFDVDINTGVETLDLLNSDAFDYDERIYAGYLNYAYSDNKFDVNVGLRVEQTDLDGMSPLTNISNSQNYLELFPNASLQYNISDGYNVYANYKRSITRPSYADLNPFRFFLNDNYVVSGNPNLVPTFLDHYVIGTTLFDMFTFEAYYQNLDGAISEIPRQNNDINEIEYISVNFDKTVEYGFDFILNYGVSKRWSLYAVTSFYNFNEEADFGQGFVSQSQWSNYSALQNDFTFLKDDSLNASLAITYISRDLQGFQLVEGRVFSELSISKTILNKKGIISLSASDLFNMQDPESSVRYQNQFSTGLSDNDTRYVKLGFRYKFGNTKLDTNARDINLEERDRLNQKDN